MVSASHVRVTQLWSVVAAVVLLSTSAAALTNQTCLAKKRKAQGKLQQCRATEEAKALQGKPADLAKCSTKFHEKIAKLSQKASEIGIGCRFVDNGNSITDYDTGLQWVETNDLDGVATYGNPQDADNTYTWSSSGTAADGTVFTNYLSLLNACSGAGSTTFFAGFAASCDWRLPTTAELQTILLEPCTTVPCPCTTSPCIDPIFGPTAAYLYWTSWTRPIFPSEAENVDFINGNLNWELKNTSSHARAVRGGL